MEHRPDVVDWGIVGEAAALRKINTRDPVDMERYWVTNKSTAPGLMVDDIETLEDLEANAKINGPSEGYTFAISARTGAETGEFQGFVQFTSDGRNTLRNKIDDSGFLFFYKGIALWEVSYARYPQAAPGQVASAVRQGCVLLLRKLGAVGYYPRLAILGCVGPDENPASVQVLRSACFDAIASGNENPKGIIRYSEDSAALDSVWLLNWPRLHRKLRLKAASFCGFSWDGENRGQGI